MAKTLIDYILVGRILGQAAWEDWPIRAMAKEGEL
jgi:hypothetical protein